ncbi:hypothetical protein DOY81_005104 [Sarcophaga bullata]|nr:hypothetical protein DOY81_005104 [Sarcophaga bullata]
MKNCKIKKETTRFSKATGGEHQSKPERSYINTNALLSKSN